MNISQLRALLEETIAHNLQDFTETPVSDMDRLFPAIEEAEARPLPESSRYVILSYILSDTYFVVYKKRPGTTPSTGICIMLKLTGEEWGYAMKVEFTGYREHDNPRGLY